MHPIENSSLLLFLGCIIPIILFDLGYPYHMNVSSSKIFSGNLQMVREEHYLGEKRYGFGNVFLFISKIFFKLSPSFI